MAEEFSYERSLKTKPEETFFNVQSLFYVTSKQITKLLYNTPVTSHQVIFISMLFGLAASYMIIQQNRIVVLLGAVLLFYKNVLDKVDGSLARARGQDSRRGRFYDSLCDFVVTLASFTAMSYKIYQTYQSFWVWIIGFTAMIFSMLHCSYFIYYQVAFIKISGKQTVNRLIETITDDDLKTEDKWTLFLQRLFLIIYGWQDKLVAATDNYFYKKLEMLYPKSQIRDPKLQEAWYLNKPFLTFASILSIGSHIILICIFAIIGRFEYYFFVNLILWNLLLISVIIYHYTAVKRKLLSVK